jgi:uncharacterized protein (DUF1684 family)
VSGCPEKADPSDPAVKAVLTFRQQREARLTSDTGWLTVAGLFWLKEGPNRFGSAPDNEIVLTASSAPPKAGELVLEGGAVTVKVAPGVKVTRGSEPVTELKLKYEGEPGGHDTLSLGALRFYIIRRGERFGVRLRDLDGPARKNWKGSEYFPIQKQYRIEARFEAHPEPKLHKLAGSQGQDEQMKSPGVARFKLGGQELHLSPFFTDGGKKLVVMFRDLTNARTTYGAGRFLYAELPRDGKLLLDFNAAFNPPCAFASSAVCPLPPRENWLQVPIEAGEKAVAGGAK